MTGTTLSATSADGTTPRDSSAREEWFTAGKLAGLVGLFLFALYPEVVLGTHSFFFRDYGLFTYPVAHHARESLWRGEVPLWNPLNYCGVPFLAQWNTTVCYPLSLIYFLLPLPWSLNYFCLGHLLLAGLGMYALAFRWTDNRLAASVAALTFALNGLTFNCLMWTSNLAAISWLPLVVLAVERAWRGGGRRVVWAALAGAMQMLTGAPEIILLTWLLLAAMCVAQGWRRTTPWRLAPARFAAIAALVFGLAAIQLLPFLDLLAHVQHDRTAGKEFWAMPAWGWANFLVPLFHCSPSILGGVYSQTDQQWTSSYYLGIGVVALALLAVWRVRKAQVAFLAGVALAGLILALGENGFVFGWLKRAVPAVGFLRYPVKFVVLTLFALPLLAAFGLDWFQRSAQEDARLTQRSLVFAGLVLLLLVASILGLAGWFPLPDDSWQATWQSGATRAGFLALMIAALLRLTRVQAARGCRLVGLAVLALVGLDALTHTPRQNPTVLNKAYGPLASNLSSLPRPGESRAMISRPMQLFLGNAAVPNPLDYYAGTRRALYANCNLIDGIPKVNGFNSLCLKEEAEVSALFYNATNALPEPLADFLGVAQISALDTMFTWQARPNPMPLMSAGQRPIFAGAPETLRALASSDFDPRRVVYLPPEARQFITASNLARAKVILRTFTAHRLGLEVEAADSAIVVAAQAFYHPWRAYVDGKPARLWRANHAFQAVAVPAGRHEVKLVYEDRVFYLGAVISGITLLACLLVWFLQRKRALATSPGLQ